MPEKGKVFQVIVSDIAGRNKHLVGARFENKAAQAEPPRELYLAGCRAIADTLQKDGFSYIPSAQKLRRKTLNFTFEVSFQSSHQNVRGELVVLWIHGYVFSPALKKWRKDSNSRNQTAYAAGGQIGNLAPDPAWLEWNLADPTGRDGQITAAAATVRRLAFPYFAGFEDIPDLLPRLIAGDIPAFDFDNRLDCLLCFGTHADVVKAAAVLFSQRPAERVKFLAALSRFRIEGLPPPNYRLSSPGDALAAAVLTYGLPDLSQD